MDGIDRNREFELKENGKVYTGPTARHAALEASRDLLNPSDGWSEIRLHEKGEERSHNYQAIVEELEETDNPSYLETDPLEVKLDKTGITEDEDYEE